MSQVVFMDIATHFHFTQLTATHPKPVYLQAHNKAKATNLSGHLNPISY